VQLSLAQPSTC